MLTLVHRTVARGREYFTFQQGRGTKAAGPRIKLPHPADESFWPTYNALAKVEPPKLAAGTFANLIVTYCDSPEFKGLAENTGSDYRRYHDRVEAAWGPLRVADLEPKHVLALRDKFASTPGAANYMVRSLSAMLSWSVPRGWRNDNPCDYVKQLKGSTPYAPWPWEAIETVRDQAAKELWWACALALYSGQRQGDVLTMKWSDIQQGCMSVMQEKTQCHVLVPVHRDLAPVLASTPSAQCSY